MNGPGTPWTHLVWTTLASFAGALTALSFRAFKDMSPKEIAFSLIVGASFAIFVGPLVSQWMFGTGMTEGRIVGAVYYVLASGSNILIPLAIRKVGEVFGQRQGESGSGRVSTEEKPS